MGKGVGIGKGGGAGRGVIPFLPKSVTSRSLVSWHRADQGTTIATGVSAWQDLYTGNFTVSQSTGSLQPGLDASTLNGKTSINFTGGKYMLFPAGYTSFITGDDKPITIFTVARFGNIAAGLYALPLSFAQNVNPTSQFMETAVSFSSGIKAGYGKSDGSSTFLNSTTNLANNTNYILQWSYTGTAITILANNTQILASSTLNKNSVTLDNAGLNILPSLNSTDIGTANWYMGEQIVYNGVLTTEESAGVYNYLRNFWGFG